MELSSEIIALRPYLFSIAYNMTGVVEDAEDIVHDVFEKWISVKRVKESKPYLARMTVNESINRLNELKKLKENYTGYWLPEPYITLEPDPAPTLDYGMLFLLERLNPLERAVFILRESFSEEYDYIAELTGTTTENCRQLLHRAHEKLGKKTIAKVDPLTHRSLTEAFVNSLAKCDRSSLEEMLKTDIELYNDGGGKRAAALKPLFGLQKVLKFLLGVMQLPENQENEFQHRTAYVNGMPAVLIFRTSDGSLDSMQYVETEAGSITRLMYVRNPDKLKIRVERKHVP